MRKFKYYTGVLILFYCSVSIAQDCDFPLPPSNTCQNAPLLCNLDGYCSNNGNSAISGAPNSFCGQIENNNWVSFIAGSPQIELKITVGNCNIGDGLQAQIFATDDCNLFNSVSNCLDPISSTANLIATSLNIGQIYYLMMDGKGGDVCDYWYEVLNGITLSPAKAVIEPPDYLCDGETMILDGSSSGNGTDLTYSWSTLDGNILEGENTSMIAIDAEGTYQILITEQGGCTDSATVNVIGSPEIIVEIEEPDTLDCLINHTVTLFGSDEGDGQTMEYFWSTVDGNILSGENTLTLVVNEPGIYLLTITNLVTGCSKSSAVEVMSSIMTPVANIESPEELNCLNSEVILNGTGSSSGNNFIYLWSTNSGNIINGATTLQPSVDEPGLYTLVVTNLYNDCTAMDEITVVENPEEPESAFFDIQHPCYGETNGSIAIDSIIGGIPPYLYSFNSLPFSSQKVFSSVPVGTYEIIIQDITGCEWDTVIDISQQQELIVDLGDDIVTPLGCETKIEALINFPIQNMDTIIWSPEVTCPGCYEQYVTPLESTIFTVLVRDQNGCEDRDSLFFRIAKERLIFIPNIFTPNNDGVNDILMIYGGKGVEKINTFRVFNRWGELVFQKDDFLPNDPNYGWNGSLKGEVKSNAVFVYYAEVKFIDDWVEVFKGDFVLLK